MSETLPISVVLTTFNSEKFIKESLDSVFNQLLSPSEIIVVDNGSSDSTRDIVEGFQIPFFVQTEGKVGTSRNLGAEKTHSQFIKYLDGDDLLEPDALEVLYWEQKTSGAPYVYGQSLNFIDPSYVAKNSGSLAHVEKPLLTPMTLTSLVDRLVFDKYGFPESDNHSWNRWFVQATAGKMQVQTISTVVGKRRIHNDNISHQQDAKSELFKLIAQKLEKGSGNNG